MYAYWHPLQCHALIDLAQNWCADMPTCLSYPVNLYMNSLKTSYENTFLCYNYR